MNLRPTLHSWMATIGLAVALTAVAPAAAVARSEKQVGYSAEKVWPAAVRFLRVDAGLTVTEKDQAAGYVLFELREEGKVFPGSLELVVVDEAVRVVITIADRPAYIETAMLAKLERKLRAELGGPAPSTPKPDPVR